MARSLLPSVGLSVLVLVAPAIAQTDTPPKGQPKVKEYTSEMGQTKMIDGVVEKVDADGITLVEFTDKEELHEHRLAPLDLHRRGEIVTNAVGGFAYRWKDLKRGDTIRVTAVKDDGDGLVYCMKICIMRRPGAKLPEGQDPTADRNYPFYRIYNDIENGEDVSDDDINKVFRPEPAMKNRDGTMARPAVPAGLPRDWQAKLDAIRAKRP
jgi:hypothetical protein